MKQLSKINAWVARIAHWGNNLSAALLLSMFVVFILQIIFRYVLGWPVLWTVEWVTIAWLWGILFSFTFVIRTSDMIRLDILYNAVPRKLQRAMDVIAGLTVALIFAYTLPHAWDYVSFMGVERTAAFRWRFDVVFAIYIPFHIAVIIRMLLLSWGGLMGVDEPEGVVLPAKGVDHD